MIRIENPHRGPVQIIVRSKVHNGGFTTLNIPGIGAGKNFYDIEEELVVTDLIERAKKKGEITTKYINTCN